jgi:hypothetical protein
MEECVFIVVVWNVLLMVVKETDQLGGGGVMVWGGISHVGKTNLKILVGNLNGIFIMTKSRLQLYSRLFEHITSIMS